MTTPPIRCAVIGAGRFGKHYVRLLQEVKGMRLEEVANDERAARDAIGDPRIDCVVIATPAAEHLPLAQAALKAGKHVLLEKPMTRTLEEAYELKKTVEETGKIFLVGHQYLYNDYIIHLKTEIENDALGNIRYLFSQHLYWGPIRQDVGCFWDAAPHTLAVVDYLFGPQRIVEATGKSAEVGGTGRDDFSAAQVLFSNGVLASLVVSWFSPEKVRCFVVAGDKGMAVFDEGKKEALRYVLQAYSGAAKHVQPKQEKLQSPKIPAREPLRNQVEHFRDCIRDGAAPRTGIEHGVRVIELLDAVSRVLRREAGALA